MYTAFFGLAQEPFSIAPDPRFLFMSEAHREALAHLLYGLGGEGGFVLLTGEIGAGKTTVCRCFLEQVPPGCEVAYVVNPKLTVVELLQTVCEEFGIPVPERSPGTATVKDLLDPLNRHVLARHAEGGHCVLVIDEAQSLSAEVLEQLRLLTNLETAEKKLLQIVLIGQPELRQMLARPELEQLAQRVVARFHLGALDEAGTAQYVRHRLAVAGLQGPLPFEPAALRRLHRLAGGVPRRINLVAGRAMLGAYALGVQRIGPRVVDRAAREVFGEIPAVRRLPAWAWVPAAAGGVIVVGAALWSTRPAPGPGTAAAKPATAASTTAAMAASSATTAASPPTLATGPAAAAMPDEGEAWRALALRWGVTLADGVDACAAAAAQGLQCLRTRGGLDLIRRLGHPVIVELQDDAGRRGHALVTGFAEGAVVLQTADGPRTMAPGALARVWRGEFATLWRPPPGWRADAPLAAVEPWLRPRLAAAAAAGVDQPLREQVLAFQTDRGLTPDGRLGPLTLIALAQAAGDAGPRLEAWR
jgi:general secretion pathway protein A